ncbi:MAG: paraquat-inducible protein A [Planctomycetota bacterium]
MSSLTDSHQPFFRACHCCGLIHQIPKVTEREVTRCVRCHARIASARDARRSASRTAAAAVAALVLFWPAVLLPVLKIEQLGQSNEQSILGGIIDLMNHGSFFVGAVVLLFSIVFPLTKIVLLIELSWLELLHRKHKTHTLRLMEHVGRWSMMDVMLLAFLVMLVKLGDLVEFHFGPAVVAFTACVAMSMIASLSFDPHAIWDSEFDGGI